MFRFRFEKYSKQKLYLKHTQKQKRNYFTYNSYTKNFYTQNRNFRIRSLCTLTIISTHKFKLFMDIQSIFSKRVPHILHPVYREAIRKVRWKFRIMLSGSNRCQQLDSKWRMPDSIVFQKDERRRPSSHASHACGKKPSYPLLLILNTLVMHNTTCAHMSEEDKGTGRELAYTLTLP